jgi:hypothetical protein
MTFVAAAVALNEYGSRIAMVEWPPHGFIAATT